MFYDANIGKDGEKGRTWLGEGINKKTCYPHGQQGHT